MFGNESAPQQGDIVWIDAEPHAGHEYGGHNSTTGNIRRPLLVISSDLYNERTGMIVGFPITSKVPNGFPAGLQINGSKIHGTAILTNLLGYDYKARAGEVADHVNPAILVEALDAIRDIFAINN
ncbi:type II toxin-antitoxin system PemK/MazF family toxin [Lactobacillus xylocopicola]|nr:type II toxin-antitoxin system PemK/MazF family toxin [Lactobacillus xylocopicola]